METRDPKNNGSETAALDAKRPERGHAARIMASAPDEQIAAALAARKFERAVDLIERHGERFLADGDDAALLGWFEQVPDALVRNAPRLAVLHAWLLVYLERYQAAASRLSEAERALRTLEMSGAHGWPGDDDEVVALEPFGDLKRGIRAVRAHLAWIQGDVSHIPHSVDEVMLPSSADHPVWRARALVTLGRCHYLAGSLDDARDDLDAALACALASRQRRSRTIALDAQVVLGRVHEAAGRLDAARALYDEVIRSADGTREQIDLAAAAQVGLGRVALSRLDLEAAHQALGAGLAGAEETSSQAVVLDGLIALAWLEQARGEEAAARDALDRADRFLKANNRRWAQEIVSAHRARLAVARGDGPAAKRWAQQFALRGADRLGPIRELQLVTQGLALLASGDGEGAMRSLDEAREAAASGGHRVIEVEAAVGQARTLTALGKPKEAAQALSEALALAAEAGIARAFVEEGPLPAALVDVLQRAKKGPEAALAERVLAARPVARAERPSAVAKAKVTAAKAKGVAQEVRTAPIETSQPVSGVAPVAPIEATLATAPTVEVISGTEAASPEVGPQSAVNETEVGAIGKPDAAGESRAT